jgi:hypothetical protein
MWSTSRDLLVDSQYLFLQGKHTLYVTARFVGHPESEDLTPAEVPLLIDVLAPAVSLVVADSGVTINAYDYVSDISALKTRWRITEANGSLGDWNDWRLLETVSSIPGATAQSVEVQVMDEAGNVADTDGLIRGRPDPTIGSASSACSCTVPGASRGAPAGMLAWLGASAAALLLVSRRRRTGAIAVGSLGMLAAATQGCSCGGNGSPNAQPEAGPMEASINCGPGCDQPCGPANLQGLIGEYTSYAVASDGTIWAAGYNDADVTNGLLYGDLVAGKYDTTKQKVAWTDVDGLPAPPGDGDCPPNPSDTWRNGLTDPGPDVGLWTSIQLDSSGNPMISYYDATNAALKFARSPDGGKTWVIHTVMQQASSDIGRYSKMLVVNGNPVVAFLVQEPGTGGWALSKVTLATAKSGTPSAASDWTFQDALVDAQTPCQPELCATSSVCVSTTTMCQPTVTGCKPSDCGASEAGIGSTPESCVTVEGGPACEAVESATYVGTYPDAYGDYISLANGPQGLGLVIYDRTRGNLVGAALQGGTWNAQILDGQMGASSSPTRVDTGDVGIGASLVIDSSGTWHVSYDNGFTEALEYIQVPSGNLSKPLAPEVVDDGLHLSGQVYPDGQHIMGDDSSLSVDASGNIRIVYADSTAGTLHEATAAPGSGNTHTWTVKLIAQANVFAGLFPHYLTQSQQIANWYRATDHTMDPPVVTGDVAMVAP